MISLHSNVTTDSVSRLYHTRTSRQNTLSITAMKCVRFNTIYCVLFKCNEEHGIIASCSDIIWFEMILLSLVNVLWGPWRTRNCINCEEKRMQKPGLLLVILTEIGTRTLHKCLYCYCVNFIRFSWLSGWRCTYVIFERWT